MKKLFSVILIMLLVLSMCACGSKEPEWDLDDEIHSAVQAKAAVYCMFEYADVKNVLASVTNTEDNGNGTYDVKGYVTVIDAYGDRYKGKFDAVVSVTEGGDATCRSFDLETPRKE